MFMSARKIIHIDMDAFYASVEQRDQPQYRGKPVIVGGSPHSRGVVCAASYEARRFGVRSAMPCARAYQLCPEAIFVSPDFKRYKAVSRQIHEVFQSFTDTIEPLSLDEAFLDVTDNKFEIPSATLIAEEIRRRIRQDLQLTASAGVSTCKFIAKIASDYNKPNGICVVPPPEILDFLGPLPIRRVPGIGKRSEQRMHELGIRCIADLRALSLSDCQQYFGNQGQRYYELARGIDERPVEHQRERVSIGVEHTYAHDVDTLPELIDQLHNLSEELARRLQRANCRGHELCLKVKYHDFKSFTHQRSVSQDLWTAEDIFTMATQLFHESVDDQRAIRLLGLSAGQLDRSGAQQQAIDFFAMDTNNSSNSA